MRAAKFLKVLAMEMACLVSSAVGAMPLRVDEAEITFTAADGSGNPDPLLNGNPPLKIESEREGDRVDIYLVNVSELIVAVAKHAHLWDSKWVLGSGERIDCAGGVFTLDAPELLDHILIKPLNDEGPLRKRHRLASIFLGEQKNDWLAEGEEDWPDVAYLEMVSYYGGHFPTVDRYVEFSARVKLAMPPEKAVEMPKVDADEVEITFWDEELSKNPPLCGELTREGDHILVFVRNVTSNFLAVTDHSASMNFAHILRSGERTAGGALLAGNPRDLKHRVLSPKGYGYRGNQKLLVLKILPSEARDFWLEDGEHRPAAAAFEGEYQYGGLFPPANRHVRFDVRIRIALPKGGNDGGAP